MLKKRNLTSSANWRGGAFFIIYATLIILFFLIPILFVVVFSFNSGSSATNFQGFSFRWYQKLFSDSSMGDVIFNTFSIAILATLVSTFIGTLGALGLAEMNKNRPGFVNLVLNLNNIPVVNPDIVTAAGLYALFWAMRDIVNFGYFTMLLAHIAFCTPYVIIQVYPKVLALDPAEMEAAMDLGATRRQAIVKVVIPDLLPAILSGALMAFTMSFDDFIISFFVGGKTFNIATFVYGNTKKFDNSVNALSALIFLAIGLGMLIFQIVNNRLKPDDDKRENRKAVKVQ
jgi:spermidine/putrescine transport system permease protein